MKISRVLITGSLFAAMSWAQGGGTSSTPSDTASINKMNANNLCRVFFSVPKNAAQYEAARKKHNMFHQAQKDTWSWNTWLIDTGDNTGTYVTSSCGHSWKDFDDWEAKMGKADTADAAASLGPVTQSGRNGFYVYRADMSLAPPGRPIAPMVAVTVYVLRPGAAPDFIAAIKRVNEALSKQADWPKTSGWLQLVNGGEGPTFVLLSDRKNFADFAPLPKSVIDVITETYGKEQADAIQKTIRDSTARLSTESATYRADLSYNPGK
jgi:hypothetical protein